MVYSSDDKNNSDYDNLSPRKVRNSLQKRRRELLSDAFKKLSDLLPIKKDKLSRKRILVNSIDYINYLSKSFQSLKQCSMNYQEKLEFLLHQEQMLIDSEMPNYEDAVLDLCFSIVKELSKVSFKKFDPYSGFSEIKESTYVVESSDSNSRDVDCYIVKTVDGDNDEYVFVDRKKKSNNKSK